MFDSGDMRERVTIQQRAAGVDALGQPSTTWEDVAEVWAAVQPLRGREFFAAGQTQSPVDVRVRIRHRSGVEPTMRAIWRDVPHDIVSVVDVEARRTVLELMCSTAARDSR
jgi:SPP1 family predicted phage head-tail adaptor